MKIARSPFAWIQYAFYSEPKNPAKRLFHQVHGNKVLSLDSTSVFETLPEADGAYTFEKQFELRVFSADCLPILFFTSDSQGPISAVHSGWRGAKDGIALKAVEALAPYRDQLWAAFGPTILGCCFEVKEDFIEAFRQSGTRFLNYLETRGSRRFFHLARFVAEEQLGFLERSNRLVWTDVRCTMCSQPPLPSFRRDKIVDPWICASIETF